MNSGPVWIDLANSPHVLFFQPVIAELKRRGIDTVVSARDFAQTVDLCRLLGMKAEVIGEHGGASALGKTTNLATRARDLRCFARSKSPRVAACLGSYAQLLAARTMHIPAMTLMDYEFQPANNLSFRLANLVAVPDTFPLDILAREGAVPRKVWRYHGLKEQIALAGFEPQPGYLRTMGIDDSRPVIVVRPPADMALYHRFENHLYGELLAKLDRARLEHMASVVLIPRTQQQAAKLAQDGFDSLVWRGKTLDGRQLIAAADLVVSAGGSMNREAAALGTPAASIYAGQIAAVDRALIAVGRLTLLRHPRELEALRLVKKLSAMPTLAVNDLLGQYVDRLLDLPRP